MQNFNEFLFAARPQIACHLPPRKLNPRPKAQYPFISMGVCQTFKQL